MRKKPKGTQQRFDIYICHDVSRMCRGTGDAVVIRKVEDNANEVQLNKKCCRVSFGIEETVTKKRGAAALNRQTRAEATSLTNHHRFR